jgi:CRP-like cAMP-binding protein
VYYAFRRADIEIPYPVQVQIDRVADRAAPDWAATVATLAGVEILAALDENARTKLAQAAAGSLYAAGEVVVRQGDAGSSMFVVSRGELVVVLEPEGREVARVRPGGYFGEMSLLTGAARTATVRAQTDAFVLEITADLFRQFVQANPAAVEQIGLAVAARAAELDQLRHEAGAPVAAIEATQTFLARVRRFLRLNFTA